MKSKSKNYKCEFYDICPDINELNLYRENQPQDTQGRFEDLINQEDELCLSGGFKCSLKEQLSEKLVKKRDKLFAAHLLTGGILSV